MPAAGATRRRRTRCSWPPRWCSSAAPASASWRCPWLGRQGAGRHAACRRHGGDGRGGGGQRQDVGRGNGGTRKGAAFLLDRRPRLDAVALPEAGEIRWGLTRCSLPPRWSWPPRLRPTSGRGGGGGWDEQVRRAGVGPPHSLWRRGRARGRGDTVGADALLNAAALVCVRRTRLGVVVVPAAGLTRRGQTCCSLPPRSCVSAAPAWAWASWRCPRRGQHGEGGRAAGWYRRGDGRSGGALRQVAVGCCGGTTKGAAMVFVALPAWASLRSPRRGSHGGGGQSAGRHRGGGGGGGGGRRPDVERGGGWTTMGAQLALATRTDLRVVKRMAVVHADQRSSTVCCCSRWRGC